VTGVNVLGGGKARLVKVSLNSNLESGLKLGEGDGEIDGLKLGEMLELGLIDADILGDNEGDKLGLGDGDMLGLNDGEMLDDGD